MKHYDVIFLDRDGTLNPDPGYIASLEQFSFYDYTLPALQRLAQAGCRFCIVSNQSGVSRGLISRENLDRIHDYISASFEERKIPLLGTYVCTDHPDAATQRRKPAPGLFLEAAADHQIDLRESLMIGDAVSDIMAGINLGMDTMLVLSGKGEKTIDELGESLHPTFVVETLKEGAALLLQ